MRIHELVLLAGWLAVAAAGRATPLPIVDVSVRPIDAIVFSLSARTESELWLVTVEGEVLVSEDGGQTFCVQPLVGVDPMTWDRLSVTWLSPSTGILRAAPPHLTVDAGTSWQPVPVESPGASVVTHADGRTWLGGRTLTRSDDEGRTWTLVTELDDWCNALSFASRTTGWALVGSELRITEDAGKTWRTSAPPEMGILAGLSRIHCWDARTGWLQTSDETWLTQDGGMSWKLVRTSWEQPTSLHVSSLRNGEDVRQDLFTLSPAADFDDLLREPPVLSPQHARVGPTELVTAHRGLLHRHRDGRRVESRPLIRAGEGDWQALDQVREGPADGAWGWRGRSMFIREHGTWYSVGAIQGVDRIDDLLVLDADSALARTPDGKLLRTDLAGNGWHELREGAAVARWEWDDRVDGPRPRLTHPLAELLDAEQGRLELAWWLGGGCVVGSNTVVLRWDADGVTASLRRGRDGDEEGTTAIGRETLAGWLQELLTVVTTPSSCADSPWHSNGAQLAWTLAPDDEPTKEAGYPRHCPVPFMRRAPGPYRPPEAPRAASIRRLGECVVRDQLGLQLTSY
ncbi:MAG: sialidase family protein [Acidobacteriota bacterium]